MMKIRYLYICLFLQLFISNLYSQTFDNATRAVYILDIAKYVKWTNPEFANVADFNIGVLSNETSFFWELTNAAKSRQFIQQKPIKVFSFRDIEKATGMQVLFVANGNDFSIKEVLKKLKGTHTLLITENCEFQLSMINFVVVNGKTQFEANEQLMKEEGLTVSQLFLAQAIKTRVEWEQLFVKTDIELTKEKETVQQQTLVIAEQKTQISKQELEIARQKDLLKQLDNEITAKKAELDVNLNKLKLQSANIALQKTVIEKQKLDVDQQKQILNKQQSLITNQESKIKQREEKIKSQNLVLAQSLALIEKQKIVLTFSFILILAFGFLIYFIFRSYNIKKKANIALEEKNRTIMAQKAEIEEQRDVARMQRDQIAFQKRHIMDSIEYAKRIQRAILPSLELFSDRLEHFVLYKPKDVVSGDFYWQTSNENELIVVTADCTGHGVPGAFMSMLGVSLLNEIVIKQGITSPDLILNRLREEIINSLKQREKADMKDGMDVTICNIKFNESKLYYAGANNPLYLIRNNELIEIKADKMPAAIHAIMNPFKVHEIELQKGDTIYTSSDGYADQFGGPDNKKYLSRNFKNALLSIQPYNMLEQGERLNEIFEGWRGEFEQLDDVVVIGIKY